MECNYFKIFQIRFVFEDILGGKTKVHQRYMIGERSVMIRGLHDNAPSK